MTRPPRDHGGGLDAAIARWGGARADWIDLSTGINPEAWPIPDLTSGAWTALPDRAAEAALCNAARAAWQVPAHCDVLAAPGASILIAQMPHVLPGQRVCIRPDTYNEHAAAFRAAGWQVGTDAAPMHVLVHPNNPTGEFAERPVADHALIDESFCDTAPARSMVAHAGARMTVLKSFGKFWGLAGVRLGFAIGSPAVIDTLRSRIGPWPVSGPALAIATAALGDMAWAGDTRARLTRDTTRLDALLSGVGLTGTGDCPLFRLIETDNARIWHDALAERHILTRAFPYAPGWLRLGLPPARHWNRLDAALHDIHGTVGGATAQPSVTLRPHR